MWCKILHRVPNSLLWLLRFPPLAEANLKAEAKARGIDERRIYFTDAIPRYQHLKRTVSFIPNIKLRKIYKEKMFIIYVTFNLYSI